MGYVTNTDIQTRLGNAAYVQLSDDNGDGFADAPVVDEARLAAEGEVNALLAIRYSVPIDLSAHPELTFVLRSITLDIVEYRLRARRPPIPADSVRRRDEAVDWLTRVADGRADLPSSAPVAANPAHDLIARAAGAERVLSREELSEY
jgi:phage gp36-like protein